MSKNILYVSFEPLKQGHASYTHVMEIIQGLEKRDWNVELLAPAYDKTTRPRLFSRLLMIIRITISVIFRKKFDLLYSRMHFSTYFIIIYCRIRNIPIATEINGPFEDLYIAWPFAKYFRILFDHMMKTQLRLSKIIISVTPGLDKYARNILTKNTISQKLHIIPNGANTDLFKPETNLHKQYINYGLKPESYAIFFGSFAPWQGIQFLLDSATSTTWPKELKLVIVGDGALKNKIKKISNNYEHIHYLGILDYKEMPGLIANASISFVLSDTTANRHITGLYPLKLFESMACGTPVIITDQPGQSNVVNDSGGGVILKHSDPETLCNTIKNILKDNITAKKMGSNGREYVVEHHSWDILANKTHQALSEII